MTDANALPLFFPALAVHSDGAIGGSGDTLPNYRNPARNEPDIILPTTFRAAHPLSPAGAWGAYVTIVAVTAADYVLTRVHVEKAITNTDAWWIEISTLPGGIPTPIAYVGQSLVFAASPGGIMAWDFDVGPIKIPAGATVRCRGWVVVDGGLGIRNGVMLSLIPAPSAAWFSPWPNTYIDGGRVTMAMRRIPAVPAYNNVNGNGPGWTVLFIAGNELLLNAAEIDQTYPGPFPAGMVLEIATGLPGSEVIQQRIPFPDDGFLNVVIGRQSAGRKAIVHAGETVSARWQTGGAYGPFPTAIYVEDFV